MHDAGNDVEFLPFVDSDDESDPKSSYSDSLVASLLNRHDTILSVSLVWTESIDSVRFKVYDGGGDLLLIVV